jgi:iron complex transport system ATP-binding protein
MVAQIKLNDAGFNYGDRDIFSNLSFELNKGDILCLLGPNGCGKTTLLRCLRGFLKLKKGNCFLDGDDISFMKKVALAKRMGFIFQEHSAPFPYSVIEVVRMGRVPHLKLLDSPTKHDTKIAEDALDTVGILHLRDRIYTQISGGERQLTAIARTLAQKPDVILMDEPTSALDFKNQTLVLRMIKKLAKQGLTIIMSSHFPNNALFFSSKVALMHDRRFIALGKADEVINEANLETTYGIGVRILTVDDPVSGEPVKFCIPVDEDKVKKADID